MPSITNIFGGWPFTNNGHYTGQKTGESVIPHKYKMTKCEVDDDQLHDAEDHYNHRGEPSMVMCEGKII